MVLGGDYGGHRVTAATVAGRKAALRNGSFDSQIASPPHPRAQKASPHLITPAPHKGCSF